MSAAPEIARLAEAVLLVPAPAQSATGPQDAPHHDVAAHEDRPATSSPLTLGTLARHLRLLAATPERWWGLVRFDPVRSVKIGVEDHLSYQAWLVVLPPGDTGQDCDCDVAAVIAGEATEGAPGSAVLRPGGIRVHGPRHRLRGRGAGYSISLHARAHRPATRGNSPARNLEVLG
jgi:hypothetical protein